jgi:hypothetical protein
VTYGARIALRHTPDPAQVQVVLGALLGRGRLVADVEGVRLVIALAHRHGWLAEWTYERIAPLAPMPQRGRGRVVLRSEAHPLFGDLASALCHPRQLLGCVKRDGLWVWAMYARIAGCERLAEPRCACAPATPPPLRTVRRAS